MAIDGIRRYILGDPRQRLHQCGASDRHSPGDDTARGDPSAVVDGHGPGDETHVRAVGVAPGGDEGVLGDHGVVADGDLVLVVDPHALADPGVVADPQLPGELDAGAGPDDDTVSHLGPEQAQSLHADTGTDLPGVVEDQLLGGGPGVDHPLGAVPRLAGAGRLGEVDDGDVLLSTGVHGGGRVVRHGESLRT